jgi:hypothetical protein
MTNHSNRREFLKATSLVPLALMSRITEFPHTPKESTTWKEVKGQVYGAKPDKRGPIGGGIGYGSITTGGDFEVENLDELIDALSKVKSGQTVFIKGEAEIDLTADVYIDQFFLEIPAGVTLAGNRGHNGSKGAILTSDALKTPILIKVGGADTRITGLRVRGPNSKRYMRHHKRSFSKDGLGRDYYYKLPTSNGIVATGDRLEVDNCEITAFAHAGVYLRAGIGHRIHHNFIHHCQYHGLGYGVSHDKSSSLIEFNQFNANRHSIAGTGSMESEYIARHNVELGIASSHCFDMHGGRDRKDGSNIAGRKIVIHNNTFLVPDQQAVVVRGEPVDTCEIYQNWFPMHAEVRKVVRGESKTRAYNNLYEANTVI